MTRFGSLFGPLTWLTALLLAALVAGCGTGSGDQNANQANTAAAAIAPTLGAEKVFAVLGGTTVTNTGRSVITGNLGVSPGAAITGFPPGIVAPGQTHAADTQADQAQIDTTKLYNDLEGQACTSNMTDQDLGGKTLVPGVYCF